MGAPQLRWGQLINLPAQSGGTSILLRHDGQANFIVQKLLTAICLCKAKMQALNGPLFTVPGPWDVQKFGETAKYSPFFHLRFAKLSLWRGILSHGN